MSLIGLSAGRTARPALVLLGGLLLGASLAGAEEQPTGVVAYMARCARCHGEDGRTDTDLGRVLKVAPLAGDRRLASMSLDQIVAAIRDSPKHRAVVALTDDEIQNAVPFVHELAVGQ